MRLVALDSGKTLQTVIRIHSSLFSRDSKTSFVIFSLSINYLIDDTNDEQTARNALLGGRCRITRRRLLRSPARATARPSSGYTRRRCRRCLTSLLNECKHSGSRDCTVCVWSLAPTTPRQVVLRPFRLRPLCCCFVSAR